MLEENSPLICQNERKLFHGCLCDAVQPINYTMGPMLEYIMLCVCGVGVVGVHVCITSTLSMYDTSTQSMYCSWYIYSCLLFDSIRHFILELQIVCAVAVLLLLVSHVLCINLKMQIFFSGKTCVITCRCFVGIWSLRNSNDSAQLVQ